tara:strand:+ start:602 stop:901 length:300 start_codon:yes stop_codon:yes gene_type:complete
VNDDGAMANTHMGAEAGAKVRQLCEEISRLPGPLGSDADTSHQSQWLPQQAMAHSARPSVAGVDRTTAPGEVEHEDNQSWQVQETSVRTTQANHTAGTL